MERFINKQKDCFNLALNEIKNGKKLSHWMWYIFPQISGLGYSYMSKYYAINNKEEAISYFLNDYLRGNYLLLCEELLKINESDPVKIFGHTDAKKLHSSLTLFYLVSNNEKIHRVLIKYFNGLLDEKTILLLNDN